MRRLAPILVALVLACVGPAADARLMVNQLVGFGVKAGPTCGTATLVWNQLGGTLTNVDSLQTYSLRQVIDAISTGGTQVRARFYASTSASVSFVLKRVSVGIRSGATASMTTNPPVELTFNDGQTGVSIASANEAWSDWVNLTTAQNNQLIVVMDYSDTATQGASRRSTVTGLVGRYGEASTESSTQSSPPGFATLAANIADGVMQVEVRTCS